jgi:hypothetical protein
MKKPILFLTLALASLVSVPRWVAAQEILKHPRVVEIEDRLNKDASEYIKARFPNVPFMVSISVDPLRRDLRSPAAKEESLPYYDSEDEEMRDEWDNPQVPLMALINRVKRIQVKISIPQKLSTEEVTELKDGVYNTLHLTPARDSVDITRREWIMEEVPWVAVYVAGTALLGLLLGLLIINRGSANRIAKALSEVKIQTSGGGGGASPMAPVSMGDRPSQNSNQSSLPQELTFNDPIKLKELASHHVHLLVRSKAFPIGQDVFILDEFGKENPEKLGAILAEFPAKAQRDLFSFGADLHWVKAMTEPGQLDFECLEIMQTMTQFLRDEANLDWQRAVLSVWRLNHGRTQFVKGLEKDEALALLSEMPKSVAISEARMIFPGSWASLLDASYKPSIPDATGIMTIAESAQLMQPLNNMDMISRYRTEKELITYLRVVTPAEERDIYGAASQASLIHSMRPPFFPVLDQSPETLRLFVPRMNIDMWALALFNLPKPERSKIETVMNEKQRFLLIDRLKRFDQSHPTAKAVGEIREQIGIAFKNFLSFGTVSGGSVTELDMMSDGDGSNEQSEAA